MRFLIVLVFAILISCKEKPNYNPFDNQFNISVKDLTSDGIDTVIAGCGYLNLQEKEGGLKVYYQTFFGGDDNFVAKGFTYIIDTIPVIQPKENLYRSKDVDSIRKLPFNQESFNLEIRKFGFKVLSQEGKLVSITNENLDTISFEINYFHSNGKDVIRSFDYYKPNLRNP